MKKQYLAFLLFISLVALLPLNWYSNMKVNIETFEVLGTTGIDVMLDDGLRVGLIFILVAIIQILSAKCNMTILSILTKVLFCIVLIVYPIIYYENTEFIAEYIFDFYSIGFYLSILVIFTSIFVEIITVKKHIKQVGGDVYEKE